MPADIRGLTAAEVKERQQEGKINVSKIKTGKSIKDIVKNNIFTRINFLLGFFFVLVLSTGSIKNALFGFLIIINSLIGIVQEVRAKKTLDKLSLLSKAKVTVIRDQQEFLIYPEDIVLDDILLVGPGEQIVVDGKIIKSDNLMVNESMLTGESDPIAKNIGDKILSGSFVSSGSACYQATSVGDDSSATKMINEASKFTLTNSEIVNGINSILKVITWIIVPVGILTIYSQLFKAQQFSSGQGIHARINKTILEITAALVPMIPEGLVLMTSIAFALGVIRLGRINCLVQELPAVEGLARVNTVCADKTGTLTDNSMTVSEVYEIVDNNWLPLDKTEVEDRANSRNLLALKNVVSADDFPNDSIKTIKSFFKIPLSGKDKWEKLTSVPFSSAYKWSGVSFKNEGSWILGAFDVLLGDFPALRAEAEKLASSGVRVLVFGEVAKIDSKLPSFTDFRPTILLGLQQNIRADAADTISYFHKQNVDVKVISGDNPISVAAVTSKVGVGEGTEPLDARKLVSLDKKDFQNEVLQAEVIGRVTPVQKKAIVDVLQGVGKTVAMTGDGVNDVLALKEANIGVAMGSGSPAARSVAQIVLLDNKFSSLPAVVGEGRRVIGNIERVSKLFLSKTIYSVFIALFIGILQLFRDYNFPFQPIHTTIISWFTIGVPAFVLSLAPNNEIAKPDFVKRVLQLAVPMGISLGASVIITFLLHPTYKNDIDSVIIQTSTSCMLALIIPGIWLLCVVARPLNFWRVNLIIFCFLAYLALFSIGLFRNFCNLDFSDVPKTFTGIIVGLLIAGFIELLWRITNSRSLEPVKIWQDRKNTIENKNEV